MCLIHRDFRYWEVIFNKIEITLYTLYAELKNTLFLEIYGGFELSYYFEAYKNKFSHLTMILNNILHTHSHARRYPII